METPTNAHKHLTKIYIVSDNANKIYVATKQNPAKYFNSILHKKTEKFINDNKLLIEILNSKYTLKFHKYFHYNYQSELKSELQELNDLQIRNEKLKLSINRDYDYAIQIEDTLLPILNSYFQENIISTRDNRFCRYDYISLDTGSIFELKSNKYSIDKFENAVISVDKINALKKYKANKVLLFSYINTRFFLNKSTLKLETLDTTDFYYIIYDYNLFNNFNIEYDTLINRDCVIQNYKIPTRLLTKIEHNKTHKLQSDINITNQVLDYINKIQLRH